ncbi:MAG: TetR family transcriptional regulator C-terminal domain-containing protein [Atopobiaceae bacterium]|nr:TetR family transcriptional regulator C-terminal domain-containing protein [Atopobiaceae bacterium]
MKECLADAFIGLLYEKPAVKITVTEIALRASVGRTTYFRNFSSKEDMLTFKLVKLWERWAEEHKLAERYNFSLDNALTFFEFNLSIRPLLELIYKRGLQASIYNAFYENMYRPSDSDSLDVYRSLFYSHGVYGVLDEWIERGFAESPRQMAELARAFLGG